MELAEMATTAEIVCFDHFWSRLKTGQEIDVNDRQNFIYWDEDRSSDLVDETFRINQMNNKKKYTDCTFPSSMPKFNFFPS